MDIKIAFLNGDLKEDVYMYAKLDDWTKYINTKYHLIRHNFKAKTIHLNHCSTSKQIADIFTKALGREKFEKFRMMLGMTNAPSD